MFRPKIQICPFPQIICPACNHNRSNRVHFKHLNTEKIAIINFSFKINPISAFNLTESVPSIHTGPQAFKDMINPTKKSDDKNSADHYQLEMLRRVCIMSYSFDVGFWNQCSKLGIWLVGGRLCPEISYLFHIIPWYMNLRWKKCISKTRKNCQNQTIWVPRLRQRKIIYAKFLIE